jgi:tetratricopeptide (TPR) repeat protein
MRASAVYRASFVVGIGLFGLASAVGLVWSLGTQHRLPPIEGEGVVARSIDEHRQFANLQPRNPFAYLVLGRALLAKNDLDGAARVLESSLALNPVPGEVNAALAEVYYRKGRFDDAREQAQRAYAKGAPPADAVLRQLGLARREP